MVRKVLTWTVGLLLALAAGVFLLQVVASETGEVVVLHTTGSNGATTTRLWVVEHDGDLWLRAGGGESGWYARLVANPDVLLERQGRSVRCTAIPDPGQRATVNALMAEKYGWRDNLIGVLVGGREAAVPVRLRPAPA